MSQDISTTYEDPVQPLYLKLAKKKGLLALIIPWVICGIGCLFYSYQEVLNVSNSVMTNNLMLAYHINAAALGNLNAFYYYIYFIMQIPVGMLMDHYGPRRLLTIAGLSCSIGTFLFACSHYLLLAALGRFMVGFGGAFAFVGALQLATIWLPPQKFAMISGMTMASGMLGGMISDIALTSLVDHDGWRLTLFIVAAFGVLLTMAIFTLLRDGKDKATIKKSGKTGASIIKESFGGLYNVAKRPQMWLVGLVGCLLYMPTSVYAELWGIPYLKSAYHMSSMAAGGVISMIFLGWAVGGPVMGLISDRLHQRRLLLTIGSAITAILLSVVLYVPDVPHSLVGPILFIFGFFSSVQVLVFAVARDVNCKNFVGTAIAFTNMLVMVGGVLFQPLVGVFLDLFWGGKISTSGVHLYTMIDYQYALAVLPLGLILSVFVTFFINESANKVDESANKVASPA